MSFLTPYVPTILVVNIAAGNTEYSQALPDNVRHFSIKCRTAVDLRLAFATGKVATPTDPYVTIPSGGSYNSPEGVTFSPSQTIYVAAASAVKAEIICWKPVGTS